MSYTDATINIQSDPLALAWSQKFVIIILKTEEYRLGGRAREKKDIFTTVRLGARLWQYKNTSQIVVLVVLFTYKNKIAHCERELCRSYFRDFRR